MAAKTGRFPCNLAAALGHLRCTFLLPPAVLGQHIAVVPQGYTMRNALRLLSPSPHRLARLLLALFAIAPGSSAAVAQQSGTARATQAAPRRGTAPAKPATLT